MKGKQLAASEVLVDQYSTEIVDNSNDIEHDWESIDMLSLSNECNIGDDKTSKLPFLVCHKCYIWPCDSVSMKCILHNKLIYNL